jgi:AAA family ATP:ADP antiporter
MTAASTKTPPAGGRPRFREHPIEFILALFGEVRPGEGTTVVLLTVNVFLILSAYYLLKVAREPLILLGGGAAVKSYASVGQSILLVFVASAYGWLSARVGRLVLVSFVSLFFVANLFVFIALGRAGVGLGIPFFLWVGIFNVVTIAQFWSFAADVYTEEQGKRLFAIVGIGSTTGAVAGAAIAAPLVHVGSPFTLMGVAAVLLLIALGFTTLVHRRETRRTRAHEAVAEPLEHGAAFALVLRDRYLLTFALLVLALNFVTKSGDYALDSMLLAQSKAHAEALGVAQSVYIGQFKAHYFQLINVTGVVMQLFLVSRIVKYAGLRAVLVLIPLASTVGYGATLLLPMIEVLFVARIIESSLDYSLSNTSQQTLWLVTTREAKYKAKQVIDTFFKRAGDTMSAAVVWLSVHFALSTRSFLAINVALSLAWIGLAVMLGRGYVRRSATPTARAEPPVTANVAPSGSL